MMNENKYTHQAMNYLEWQVSQMASQMDEREKGMFPSQPVTNPKDARGNTSGPAQINIVRTLRSNKKVDNQVGMPISINSTDQVPDPFSQALEK